MNNIATLSIHNKPVCSCPHCNSASITRFGFDRGTQRYRCKSCYKTFKATAGTPVHGLHKKEKINQYLEALRKGMSVRKAAKYIGVSKNTSFAWRHKFLSSLEARSVVQPTSEITSAGIIQLEYSAKGRRKPPEKHTTPTKTIILYRDGQLELHKLTPLRSAYNVAHIFSESTSNFFVSSPHKTLTAGLKHAENTFRIINRHTSLPLIAQAKQQAAKLLSWMDRFKGVASKYLHNYWNWYTTLANQSQLKQETDYFSKLCTTSRSLSLYHFTKNT